MAVQNFSITLHQSLNIQCFISEKCSYNYMQIFFLQQHRFFFVNILKMIASKTMAKIFREMRMKLALMAKNFRQLRNSEFREATFQKFYLISRHWNCFGSTKMWLPLKVAAQGNTETD